MKPVQVVMDEKLLARLDAQEEVRREGRSAVMRLAVEAWLEAKRKDAVSSAYRQAYGEGDVAVAELAGWETEGSWPEE